MTARPKILAAQAAADWLDAHGQPKLANDVRSLCRSNASLRETLSRLSLDNATLRDRIRQAEIEGTNRT